eukprot:223822_1
MSDAKDLLTKMFCVDHDERINISDIKCHSFLKGDILSSQELLTEITHTHMLAEKKRRQDARQMNDLSHSLDNDTRIPSLFYSKLLVTLYPKDDIAIEGLIGEVYTYLGDMEYGSRTTQSIGLYGLLDKVLTDKLGAHAVEFDFDRQILLCNYKLKEKQQINENVLAGRFSIRIFESRLWKDKYKELSVREIEKIKDDKEDVIFVVKMKRIQGDELTWIHVKNGILLLHCAKIIKGLPKWARKMKMKRTFEKKDQEDSYHNTLLKYEMANCF